MKKDIALGIDVAHLKDSYVYKDIVDFLTGVTNTCMYFDRLKPLYDKYGYKLVNETILELAVIKVTSRPLNEPKEVEKR